MGYDNLVTDPCASRAAVIKERLEAPEIKSKSKEQEQEALRGRPLFAGCRIGKRGRREAGAQSADSVVKEQGRTVGGQKVDEWMGGAVD